MSKSGGEAKMSDFNPVFLSPDCAGQRMDVADRGCFVNAIWYC